jgi:hypothetical protein
LAEVVGVFVEEVEDGGLLDAESAAIFADADAGIVFDEALPADFVEQEAALVTVDRFRAGAGGLADKFVPRVFEELESGAVGVVEEMVGAERTARGASKSARAARAGSSTATRSRPK